MIVVLVGNYLRFLMSNIIISIHIPKTGGTSFRTILSNVYSKKLWSNYERQWSKHDVHQVQIPSNVRCIHGHFEYDSFDEIFSENSKITWTRDPADRTVSLYNYIIDKPDPNNKLTLEVIEKQLSLEQFIDLPWVRNQGMNYLKGSSPYDFKFVGFVETYQQSLEKCAEILRWKSIPEMVWENKKREVSSNLHESLRKKIYKLNENEYDWISTAKSIF